MIKLIVTLGHCPGDHGQNDGDLFEQNRKKSEIHQNSILSEAFL